MSFPERAQKRLQNLRGRDGAGGVVGRDGVGGAERDGVEGAGRGTVDEGEAAPLNVSGACC